MQPNQHATSATESSFQCKVDQGFVDWLSKSSGSIIVSTYQAGKLLLIGWNGQQITFLPRQFDKPMGLAITDDHQQIALALRKEVLIVQNSKELAYDYLPEQQGKYDALFLPRMTFHTGELNIHDMQFGQDKLWAVNTRFSCIGFLSSKYTFEPTWKPPFISQIIPEDRCHLNGMTLQNGNPRFVTVLGQSNAPGGWRQNKENGGVIIDVQNDEIIADGLSMPHSPRWYNNKLWFLNSGKGQLCVFNLISNEYEEVCRLSGYLRGLKIIGHFALVCLSKVREKHIFGGLPIQKNNQELKCGVAIIDLHAGEQIGMLEFIGGATELYDVDFLKGMHRPNVLNLEKQESEYAYSSPQNSYWLRPEYFEDIEGSN